MDAQARTVHVSNLETIFDETSLTNFFQCCGPVVTVRLGGNALLPHRFAFVEFLTFDAAQQALSLSGTILGSSPIKVAPSRTATKQQNPQSEQERIDRTLHISNVDGNVTEENLYEIFSVLGELSNLRLCGSMERGVRFAFVEYATVEEAEKAMCLNGTTLGSLPLRIGKAKTCISSPPNPHVFRNQIHLPPEMENLAKTVYVGGLDSAIQQVYIEEFFYHNCGYISKLSYGGDPYRPTRYCFIEFEHPDSAQKALRLSGITLGRYEIKMSPGKSVIQEGVPLMYPANQARIQVKRLEQIKVQQQGAFTTTPVSAAVISEQAQKQLETAKEAISRVDARHGESEMTAVEKALDSHFDKAEAAEDREHRKEQEEKLAEENTHSRSRSPEKLTAE
eukprot:GCRY01001321.1.p1 GENE.GCRY01001321.1~~GCRY01001321.1.p1  ORF type:complete len:393 (+),score=76.43 GCRY01001321.1:175-1353(+)